MNMKRTLLVLCLTSLVVPLWAQNTGYPPYGSFEVGRFDGINRQNLNYNFAIPIVSNPGRGQNFGFAIVYDSLVWKKNGTAWSPVNSTDWGWKKDTPSGKVTYFSYTAVCNCGPWCLETTTRYLGYSFADAAGTGHLFSLNFYESATSCNFNTGPRTGYATDGSGIYIDANTPTSPRIKIPDGTEFTGSALTDTNGNYHSIVIVDSTETHWKDTLARIAIKIKKVGTTTIEYRVQDPTGTYQLYTLAMTSYSIKTNFACSGVTEYTGSATLPTTLTLPNGRTYSFTYEDTPGFAGYKTARLKRVTLPTGGYYEYTYPTTGNKGINCSDGTVVNLTRVINDGTTSNTWTFTRAQVGSNWDTTITAPQLPYDTAGNRQVFTFDSTGKLLTEKYYQGSSPLLKTINETWAANSTPSSRTIILENNQQSKTETVYDDYGNLTEIRDYDWGSGAPGSVIRTTQMTYLSTAPYINKNIRNRLTQETVREGGPTGTIKAQKSISYDTTTITATSGVVQHDYTNFPASMTTRGNPTETKHWRNTDAAWLTTTQWYDDLGNLLQTQDPMAHNTFFSYTDNWENSFCAPGTGTTQAFQTSVTNHLNHVTTTKYYSCTSQVGRTIDANNQPTTFTYDYLRRPDLETRPDGGTTNYDYDDAARKLTKNETIAAGVTVTTESYYDGLGRLTQARLTTDPEGTIFTDTTYDALSRQYTVSNPYRSTGEATYGVTETRYDGLGRETKVIPSDGTATSNNTTTTYSGNCSTVTDQAGKKRKSCSDSPGRVVQAWEPDAGGSFVYETAYQYDVLDNLTRIDEKGNDPNSANWRTRTFTYNSLKLKTAESTPEGGSVSYAYDNDGNLLTQTDARSITITYAYDALHRMTSKDFSNTAPNPDASYFYDQTSYNGLTITNGKGRQTGMSDQAGAEAWSFDSMGRAVADRRTTNSVTQQFNYEYNYNGSTKSVTYPSGRRVDYTYNAAGRTVSAIDTANSINYVTQATYGPHGALASAKNGVTGGFAGLTRTNTYNKRLQPNQLSATTPTATFLSVSYNYNLNTANNGSVVSITNNLVTGRTQSFTYDHLNRIDTAQSQATSGADCWGLDYGYDIWANLLSAAVTKCTAPALSLSVSN